ncbi:MAG: DUF3857 domain-containing protein [Chitinophagaceae bacterium]
MKKIIVFNFLLCISVCTLAQKKEAELPAFGKVDKAELQMKECPFEENAEAMILIDEAQLDYVLGASFDMKKRVRIKILSEKGLDWANVHLSFTSARNEEEIRSLEAQTYNLDDNGNIVITKVEKNLIYDKKLNKRETERSFTFPAVKVGSVIEFRYKHVNVGLIDWYFQRSVPVQNSRFKIDMPEEIEVSVIPHTSRPYDKKREESSRRYKDSYSMTNVPGFRDEPFIINEDYYMDRIETKVTALVIDGRRQSRTVNWLDVIKFLMEDEDFGVQIKKSIPRTADLDTKLKTINTPYEKMKTIYKYVQDNMQWNDYTGIWASDGVKSAWKDKKGTSGEINLILVNLLKDAGLKVFPILVSTHSNGLVNSLDAGTLERPGFRQFNKVMALVDLDGKPYVLDASQKGIPVHLTPAEVLQTQGLVIEKLETGEWGWREVTNQSPAKNLIMVNGLIDGNGKMVGQATITSYDYARLSRLPIAKKGKDKFIETYVANNQGMQVDDIMFENIDSDSLPLIQTIKFNQSLNNTGEYSYFSSNILSGLEKNPFVADQRFSDVFFGTNQSYTILGNFTLPEGFEFDALPKNIKMIMPDTSIVLTRAAQVSNGMLSTKIQVEFRKPFYAATEYSDFQEFYKRLFELINEQYVVRKKKA